MDQQVCLFTRKGEMYPSRLYQHPVCRFCDVTFCLACMLSRFGNKTIFVESFFLFFRVLFCMLFFNLKERDDGEIAFLFPIPYDAQISINKIDQVQQKTKKVVRPHFMFKNSFQRPTSQWHIIKDTPRNVRETWGKKQVYK